MKLIRSDGGGESAIAYDEPNWGTPRVRDAYIYTCGLLAIDPRELANAITEIEDHEGCLEVRWLRQPSPAECWAFGQAWERQNEQSENVVHVRLSI